MDTTRLRTYTVQAGDNLWNIAKKNNLNIADILRFNPQYAADPNKIYVGQQVNLSDPKVSEPETNRPAGYSYTDFNNLMMQEAIYNQSNIDAIQNSYHDSNYVIIDKKNKLLTVYDRNNNPLFSTNEISTGASGNDYNTVTYIDQNGRIRDMEGNNSTPAGISIISGVGTYHGVPSFTRARVDNYGNVRQNRGKADDIASSMHYGSVAGLSRGSNGCVRISAKSLKQLPNYIGVGTRVYTLPEQGGSRFEVRQGRLNYLADNPYGVQEGDRKYWDDYNTNSDRSFNPLRMILTRTGNEDYDTNRLNYAQSIIDNKRRLQEQFNIDSYTYDRLAQLAMGIAEQETKFNTSKMKLLKDITPDIFMNFFRGNSNRSRGATQIKLRGDNKELQSLYQLYGINEDNINNMANSATATMLRLASIYNNEVRGRTIRGANNQVISPYDALLYKWMGSNDEIRNKTATPDQNEYILNVKRYMNNGIKYQVGRRK